MNRTIHITEEAARCLLCIDAPCNKACKKGNPARAIRAIRFGNAELASQWITDCTDEELEKAEQACIHYDRPIRFANYSKPCLKLKMRLTMQSPRLP